MANPRILMFLGILSLLPGCPSIQAASYFLDATAGDDSWNGTSPSSPWKTFARLGTVSIKAGDSVRLARDGIWRETLRLSASGTPAAPIIVGPYGPGSKEPLVLGSKSLQSAASAGVRSAKAGARTQGVYLDGIPLPMARYPDTGWLVADALEGDTALRCAGVAATDWTGASILMRSAQWTLETHRIRQGTGGRLVLDGKMIYKLDSVRFYLANHQAAFLAAGGWYQSSADSTVHWSDPRGKSAPEVEASVRDIGIDLRGSNYLEVSGISIQGTTQKGVWFDGSGIRLHDLDIRYPGLVGIQMNGRRGETRSSRILGANGKSIVSTGSRQILYGNRISRTGMQDWLGPDGLGTGCCNGAAIETNGDSTIVRRNEVDSSGLNAITFKGVASEIDSNLLSHSCMTTEDCGTIHTWAGRFPNTGSAHSAIRHNIARDAVGAPSGMRKYYPSFQGIYLDDGSHDMRVDSNIAIGNHCGIFLHNTQNVRVRGNLAYGNRSCQILLQHDTLAGQVDMTGNRIEDNIFVSFGEQQPQRTHITRPQSAPLAEWTGNISCRDMGAEVRCDLDSTLLWKRDRIDVKNPSLGPEQLRNFGFDSSRIGWTGGPAGATLSLDSGSACPAGKCLHVGNGTDSLKGGAYANANGSIATTAGQSWRLGFRAKGSRSNQPLAPIFRRSYGDYANFARLPTVLLDTSWTSHVFLIQSSQTDTKARVDFTMPFAEKSFWLDEASFRTIPEAVADSLAGSAILLGPPIPSPGRPSGTWIDVLGQEAGPSDPGPYRGLALFRFGASGDGVRTTAKSSPGWSLESDGRTMVFRGLVAPVVLRNAQGRVIVRLEADKTGTARCKIPSRGLIWASSKGRTQAVAIIR
ncbi:MAG: right-handed parallel beta-helix repeat-containing protein [Fibrobacterota bacterium]|nr:MAG: right-handed parallel beta-helix repeat-containing protein [Fibrobacterota bacterium]